MEPIDAVIAAIKSLEPGEPFTHTELAKRFSFHCVTLSRRHQRSQVPHTTKVVNQRKLNLQQETVLV